MNDVQHLQPEPDDDDLLFWSRVNAILSRALEWLAEEHPDDFARRVEYCRQTGQHGTRAMEMPHSDGRQVGFMWGNRLLVAVDRDTFEPTAYFEDIKYTAITPPPDDASGLTE